MRERDRRRRPRRPGRLVLLHQQEDLEFLARVVERAEVVDQVRDDVGLLVHRHQHGVGRRVAGVEGVDVGVVDLHPGLVARTDHADHELEQHCGEEEQAHGRTDRGDRRPGGQDETGHQRGDREAEQRTLAGEQHLPGRLHVVAAPQAEGGLLDDGLAVGGVQRLEDVPVGGDHEVDRGAQAILDQRPAFGGGPLGGRDQDPRAVAPEREPALLGEGVRIEPVEQGEVERGGDQVDVAAVPGASEHPVDRGAADEPGRHQDRAEPAARPLLHARRPVALLGGDPPLPHQDLAELLLRGTAVHPRRIAGLITFAHSAPKCDPSR